MKFRFLCFCTLSCLSNLCYAMDRPPTPDRSQEIITHVIQWKFQATLKAHLLSNFNKKACASLECTVPYKYATCKTALSPIITTLAIPPAQQYNADVAVHNLSCVTEYVLLILIEAGHTKALAYEAIKSGIELLKFKKIQVTTARADQMNAYWISFNKINPSADANAAIPE